VNKDLYKNKIPLVELSPIRSTGIQQNLAAKHNACKLQALCFAARFQIQLQVVIEFAGANIIS